MKHNVIPAILLLAACTAGQGDIEIAGDWTDSWGQAHRVTNEQWEIVDSVFAITEYDNDDHYAIAHNDDANEYFPGLWSRFDWTYHADAWWVCQTAFDATDEDAALSTEAADAADPATTGCAGFAWSELTVDE